MLASTIQFSNHHAPRPDPTHRPTASRQGHPENRTHPKRMRVAVREPKSIPIPLPGPPKGIQKPMISSTPARPRQTGDDPRHAGHTTDARPASSKKLRRKEVIQPHLPIRLPCYDFTPIIEPTFGRALLAVRLRTSGVPDSHGVTGGVYKARERIHRGMLIRDY